MWTLKIRTASVADANALVWGPDLVIINTTNYSLSCECVSIPIYPDNGVASFDPLWEHVGTLDIPFVQDKTESIERSMEGSMEGSIECSMEGRGNTRENTQSTESEMVIVCQTGGHVSCVVGVFLSVIMEEMGFNVDATDIPAPSPGDERLKRLWRIGCSSSTLEELEENVFWYLNGEVFGPSAAVHDEY